MTARDLAIGAALVAVGIGVMGFIVAPMIHPRPVVSAAIAERWPEPQAALPKAAKLKITLAEPDLLDPAPIGPKDGDPIEQQIQRNIFDRDVSIAAKEYKRDAEQRERDVCQRHGMRKVWFHRRHREVWRCR